MAPVRPMRPVRPVMYLVIPVESEAPVYCNYYVNHN